MQGSFVSVILFTGATLLTLGCHPSETEPDQPDQPDQTEPNEGSPPATEPYVVSNDGTVIIGCTAGCPACTPGSTQACYSGPIDTVSVAPCAEGTQACSPGGTWGPCVGESLPSAEDCGSPARESCAPGCGEPSFSYKIGDDANVQAGEAVIADAQGNLYLSGSFKGTLDFIDGTQIQSLGNVYDGYLTKLGPSGNHLWTVTFGDGAHPQYAYGLAVDSAGNVLLTGIAHGIINFGGGPLSTKNQDVFVAKYAPSGQHLWSAIYGDWTGQQMGLVVDCDASDNVYVGCQMAGTVNFGGSALVSAGDLDVAVVKLSPAGSHIWSKRFGGVGKDQVNQLDADPVGNLLVAGEHDGAIDFGGGALVSPAGVSQAYIAKLNSAGSQLWSKAYPGGAASDMPSTAEGIGFDAAGNALVLGVFDQQISIGGGPLVATPHATASFLAKLDGGGDHLWSRVYQTTLARLAMTPFGGVVVSVFDPGQGSPNDMGKGSLPPGGSVGRYDGAGNLVWNRWFGQGNPNGVASDPWGNALITGDITKTINFGMGALSTASQQAMFVAKLSDADASAGPCSDGVQNGNETGVDCGGPTCAACCVPQPEQCNSIDDDCNGIIDDVTTVCYTGPAGTLGIGLCAAGIAACDPATGTFGACVGEIVPRAEDCGLPTDEDCDGTVAPACGGGPVWTRAWGAAASDSAEATAVDALGNIYATGWFQNAVDFGGVPLTGAGGRDIFLIKLDPQGNTLWAKRFGGIGWDIGWSLAVEPQTGRIVVSGSFSDTVDFGGGPLVSASAGKYDAFVASYDTSGQHLWSKRWGGSNDEYGFGVALDAQGNAVTTGTFYGTLDIGFGAPLANQGDRDIYVVKLDPSGDVIWGKSFGSVNVDYAYGIATSAAGLIAVTGSVTGTVDFGAGPVVGAGSTDGYALVLSSAGALVWVNRFGDANAQDAFSSAFAANGDLVVAGDFAGTLNLGGALVTSTTMVDALVVRFSGAGSPMWSRRLGTVAAADAARGVAVTPLGNIVVTGFFKGTVNAGGQNLVSGGGYDAFLVQYDASGNHVWSRSWGDAADQTAYWVATDATGASVVAGAFDGTVNAGLGAHVTAGGNDAYVFKFAP